MPIGPSGFMQAPPTDEFTRRRHTREVEAIIKSVEGKRIRHASRKRLSPCPACQTVEHVIGHWQGKVLVMLCLQCGREGVYVSR